MNPNTEKHSPPSTRPPPKDLPAMSPETIRALEEYFAQLAATPPEEEPEWLVEDLFPPDPR